MVTIDVCQRNASLMYLVVINRDLTLLGVRFIKRQCIAIVYVQFKECAILPMTLLVVGMHVDIFRLGERELLHITMKLRLPI